MDKKDKKEYFVHKYIADIEEQIALLCDKNCWLYDALRYASGQKIEKTNELIRALDALTYRHYIEDDKLTEKGDSLLEQLTLFYEIKSKLSNVKGSVSYIMRKFYPSKY